MTTQEFSSWFDILYNNITSSQAPGLDEYEKSVFLTREQENLVLSLYSDSSPLGSFERTEQLRRDLEPLLEEVVLEPSDIEADHIVKGSQFFDLHPATNLWFIVYEAGRYTPVEGNTCRPDGDFPVEVVPVTYDDLHRIKGNPFRGPNDRRALRLDNGKVAGSSRVEIISKEGLSEYYVKYIRRPRPIILTDLEGDLKVNGENKVSECELHSSLHGLILDGAVKAAISAMNGYTQ